jgi:hypothetical protein
MLALYPILRYLVVIPLKYYLKIKVLSSKKYRPYTQTQRHYVENLVQVQYLYSYTGSHFWIGTSNR